MEYFGPSHYIDKNGNDLTDTVSSGLRMYKNEERIFGFKNEQGDIVIMLNIMVQARFRMGMRCM